MISIVMPVYNHLDLTILTMNQLQQTTKNSYQLIIIDDGSADDTYSYLINQRDIIYYRNPSNLGVNKSWNEGIKIALSLDNPYIAIINNDLLFTDDWDEPLIQALDNGIAVASPYLTEYTVPSDWPEGQGRHRNRNMEILGSCFLFKKDLIKTVGFFPENMKHFFGDDWLLDVCIEKGLIVKSIPESYVHHFVSKTVGNDIETLISDGQIYQAKFPHLKKR